ncbi:MAG TPA: manganese efflux pump [Streptosporangiaceae bacterium]
MLALVLVAVSVGVSNLAASIGIGAGGVSAAIRMRVLLTFGLFEAAMPIIGLAIGHDLASDIGREARVVGALLLGGVGAYGIGRFVLLRARATKPSDSARSAPAGAEAGSAGESVGSSGGSGGSSGGSVGSSGGVQVDGDGASRRRLYQWIKIGVSGFALSLDNLIAGFALGSYQLNLVEGALVFGIVSIGMSLAGLELGAKLGNWAGDGGELIGGVVLVGVGVAIGTGVLG